MYMVLFEVEPSISLALLYEVIGVRLLLRADARILQEIGFLSSIDDDLPLNA